MISPSQSPARLAVMGFLGATLLAGCAQVPGVAPEPARPEAPAAAAQKGGVIQFGTRGKPDSLHAYRDTVVDGELTVVELYDKLLRYDYSRDYRVDLPVVPALAERWQQPDPTTYVFELRKGVTWHDGQPFTADDVVWSFEYLRDPKNNFRDAALLRGVNKIEKTGDLTVRVTLNAPNPQFLSTGIADPQADILPKHIFDKGGADALATAGIATGPFKVKKFDPAGTTSFVRNDTYWGKDSAGNQLPFLNGIEITHNMDQPAQEAALAARQVDIYVATDKAALDALTARIRDLNVKRYYSHHSPSVIFNQKVKPFEDLRVRKAFHLAISREEIMDTTFGGEGVVAHPAIPAIKEGWGLSHEEILKLPGYRPQKEQDLAEAKKLLAEAGFPNGFKTSLVYNQHYVEAAMKPVIAAQVKKVAIDLELRGVDGATYIRSQREGAFDTIYFNTSNYNLMLRQDQLFTSKATQNSFGMNDAVIDRLVEELRGASELQQQKEAAKKLQERYLEQVYYAPLLDLAGFPVSQPWVNNWYSNYSLGTRIEGSAQFLWFDLNKLPPARK